MRNGPPDWDDLDGVTGIPAAVLTRLPDGKVIAIFGVAQMVTQWAYRPDPRDPFGSGWEPPVWSPDSPDLGVTVKWACGYRMRWETGPIPDFPTGDQAIGPGVRELPR